MVEDARKKGLNFRNTNSNRLAERMHLLLSSPKPQILASLFCHVVPVTALRPHWNQTTDDMLSLRLIFVQTDYNLIIRTTVLKKDSEIFQVRLNCGNQNGHTG